MLVQCPHCGQSLVVNGLGRKAFNMPVTKVCDALRLHSSVLMAANALGCSRAYIYKVLRVARLTPADVIKELATAEVGKSECIQGSSEVVKCSCY